MNNRSLVYLSCYLHFNIRQIFIKLRGERAFGGKLTAAWEFRRTILSVFIANWLFVVRARTRLVLSLSLRNEFWFNLLICSQAPGCKKMYISDSILVCGRLRQRLLVGTRWSQLVCMRVWWERLTPITVGHSTGVRPRSRVAQATKSTNQYKNKQKTKKNLSLNIITATRRRKF